MKRKLVKQGSATMMVSIPSKWIKRFNLKKGDEIDLDEFNDSIVISAEKIQLKTETSIKLTDLTESSVRTLITNTYRSGYDKVKVFFENEKQFNVLNQIIKTRLIGFEVIKKDKNSCIVENITEPSSEQFETLINKIFFNINELFEITQKRMFNQFVSNDWKDIEERIQKYDNFCRRVISKTNQKGSEFLWTFLAIVFHAQREIYMMNQVISEKLKFSKGIHELFDNTWDVFKIIEKSYLKKDVSILSKVHSLEKELIYKKSYQLLEKGKGKENIITFHLMDCIRRFYQSNSPLSGLLMLKSS